MRGPGWALAATLLFIAALCVALTAGSTPAAAKSEGRALRVFAAASLSDAFTEIGHDFEKHPNGLAVRSSFSGSQQLASQIEEGAQADVFASADERWMEYAKQHGLIEGEPVSFARNRLVARIKRLQDLAHGGVKLVLGADATPVGRYSRVVLANLAKDSMFDADFAARTLRNVVSEEENVKSVVSKVQLGEADAGMVYRSDVTPNVARYVRTFEIPESANVPASYFIAVVKGAKEPEAAQAFIHMVLSAEGQQVLMRNRLMPAGSPSP
jgi:molybdate transport system substrate-binding protein